MVQIKYHYHYYHSLLVSTANVIAKKHEISKNSTILSRAVDSTAGFDILLYQEILRFDLNDLF